MALRLQRRGITRVHPLDGGFPRWLALGFPVSGLTPPPVPAVDTARS